MVDPDRSLVSISAGEVRESIPHPTKFMYDYVVQFVGRHGDVLMVGKEKKMYVEESFSKG